MNHQIQKEKCFNLFVKKKCQISIYSKIAKLSLSPCSAKLNFIISTPFNNPSTFIFQHFLVKWKTTNFLLSREVGLIFLFWEDSLIYLLSKAVLTSTGQTQAYSFILFYPIKDMKVLHHPLGHVNK